VANLEPAPKEMDVDLDRVRQPCCRFDRADEVPGTMRDQLDAPGRRAAGSIVTGHVSVSLSVSVSVSVSVS
jgi:hypothetical protein